MKRLKRNVHMVGKTLAATLLLFSVGSVSTIASAHHVYRYHPRIVRQMRFVSNRKSHKNKRGHKVVRKATRGRFVKRTKKIRRVSRWQVNRNCYELYRQTIWDINRDRQLNRLPRLRVDRRLSRIGTLRSYQLQKYFSHNTEHQMNEIDYLLNRRHIKYSRDGENIANSALGTITTIAVGSYNNPYDANESKIKYKAHNGYQLANNINNASMYHDAGDNNGHRDNILNKRYKKMGVGDSYSPRDQSYYLAIEFIG